MDWAKRKQFKTEEAEYDKQGDKWLLKWQRLSLPMNFPSYLLKAWENCPFQEHLRLLNPRPGIGSSTC